MTRKDARSILDCKLGRKFAFCTVGISFIIAIMISLIATYKTYQDGINGLKTELSQINRFIDNSVSLNLWQMNLDALNILVDSLLTDKDIVYVKLSDEEGHTLIEKGKQLTDHIIKKHIPIYYKQNGKSIYLGKLDYVATTQKAYKKSKESQI